MRESELWRPKGLKTAQWGIYRHKGRVKSSACAVLCWNLKLRYLGFESICMYHELFHDSRSWVNLLVTNKSIKLCWQHLNRLRRDESIYMGID